MFSIEIQFICNKRYRTTRTFWSITITTSPSRIKSSSVSLQCRVCYVSVAFFFCLYLIINYILWFMNICFCYFILNSSRSTITCSLRLQYNFFLQPSISCFSKKILFGLSLTREYFLIAKLFDSL